MDDQGRARFRIAVHFTQGCHFAHALDIPGCVSRGASEVEAVENARAAIRAYLLVARILAARQPTVQIEISAWESAPRGGVT